MPAEEALDRLNINPAPDVRTAVVARSSDAAGAETGLAWLSAMLLGEEFLEDYEQHDVDGLWDAAAEALDEHQAQDALDDSEPPLASVTADGTIRPLGRSLEELSELCRRSRRIRDACQAALAFA